MVRGHARRNNNRGMAERLLRRRVPLLRRYPTGLACLHLWPCGRRLRLRTLLRPYSAPVVLPFRRPPHRLAFFSDMRRGAGAAVRSRGA